jgi:hypothetical protein
MGGTCIRNDTQFLCKCPSNRIGSQCEKHDPCQVHPCIGYGYLKIYSKSFVFCFY